LDDRLAEIKRGVIAYANLSILRLEAVPTRETLIFVGH